MMPLRRHIFVYIISLSLLVSFVAPAIALDKSEKTEVIIEKPDSAEVKSLEKKTVTKKSVEVRKVERATQNSSYTFIFYLVAMIVKAFSYSPQR